MLIYQQHRLSLSTSSNTLALVGHIVFRARAHLEFVVVGSISARPLASIWLLIARHIQHVSPEPPLALCAAGGLGEDLHTVARVSQDRIAGNQIPGRYLDEPLHTIAIVYEHCELRHLWNGAGA